MKKTKIVLLCVAILLIFGAVLAAFTLQNRPEPEIENAGIAQHGVEIRREITYDGDIQKLRHQIDTVLFIGVDDDELPQYEEGQMIPYYNYQQADFLVLGVFDHLNRTVQLIQINRDTMTLVPWLGVLGDVGGYAYEQITLSHNSGSGLKDSCVNTANAVSDLLFGLPIDHYIKITMGAVPVLNDIIGGVPVTIPYDLTELDKEYTEGAYVTLMGEKALEFVRARKGVSDGTNISRMGRQRLYINSYMDRAGTAFGSNPELMVDTVNQLGRFMLTDMSSEQMLTMANCFENYEIQDFYTPEGRNLHDEHFYEFFPYYDRMWEKMKEIVG